MPDVERQSPLWHVLTKRQLGFAAVTPALVVGVCFVVLGKAEGTKAAIQIFASALGAAIAARIGLKSTLYQLLQNQSLSERTRRTDLTFRIFEQFSSSERLKSRMLADALAWRHIGKSYAELYVLLREEEYHHLWAIIRFYEQLTMLVHYQRIDVALVPELSGQTYIWWFYNFIDPAMISQHQNRTTNKRLRELSDWFCHNASPDDHREWQARALQDLATRKHSAPNPQA